MVPQLVAKDGRLYMPNGTDVILVIYREGDCDDIPWPLRKKDRKNLATALYGEFECGNLSERTVALPNGEAFNIDMNLVD